MARQVVAEGLCSGRAACRILKVSRATYWYRGRPPTPAAEQLRQRLRELSAPHSRYGCRWIAALLRREGRRVGKRQMQRLRRAEGLRVPPTKRKRCRRGTSTGLPTHATHRGQVWTWNFIAEHGAPEFLRRDHGSEFIAKVVQRWLAEHHFARNA